MKLIFLPTLVQRLEIDPALANATDESGLSAVLTAAYYQEPNITDLLVQRGAELNVFEARAVGDLSRVKEWVEQQPELINANAPDGFQPLGLVGAVQGYQADDHEARAIVRAHIRRCGKRSKRTPISPNTC